MSNDITFIHPEPHPLAGKTVTLNENAKDPARGIVVPGAQFCIEDWVDRINGDGRSWMFTSNFATMHYGARSGLTRLPLDDEVVYGKVDALGHIVHVSELGDPVEERKEG